MQWRSRTRQVSMFRSLVCHFRISCCRLRSLKSMTRLSKPHLSGLVPVIEIRVRAACVFLAFPGIDLTFLPFWARTKTTTNDSLSLCSIWCFFFKCSTRRQWWSNLCEPVWWSMMTMNDDPWCLDVSSVVWSHVDRRHFRPATDMLRRRHDHVHRRFTWLLIALICAAN